MADRPRWHYALFVAVFVVLVVGYLYASGALYDIFPPGEYERVTVTAYDENGTELATVTARVADTRRKRRVGLSNTESLESGEGMLFVHGSEGRQTYVMREMSFPIDIVFVDASETVTAIHHASVPEGSWEETYSGEAKWVLEVPRGWANRTGVDVGDRIAVPPPAEEP